MNPTDGVPSIEIMRTVFPVLALADEPGQVARPEFFGTAFAVAPGVFMTAAHVVREAMKYGSLALGGPSSVEGQAMLGAVHVVDHELWPDRDVALLFCRAPEVTVLNTWLINRVQLLTDLSAFGYPHAVTHSPSGDRLNVVFRGYKGHVITTRGFDRLSGEPAVYEVSCPFPEGLSGAPLLLGVDDNLIVVGVVLGVETVTYGGVSHSVGIAIVGDQICNLESSRLKGRIGAGLGFAAATYGPPGATAVPI